jgi:hypothetical protein
MRCAIGVSLGALALAGGVLEHRRAGGRFGDSDPKVIEQALGQKKEN